MYCSVFKLCLSTFIKEFHDDDDDDALCCVARLAAERHSVSVSPSI